MNNPDTTLTPQGILDSLNDGVYAVDRDRRILYWGESAQHITGWEASDILGKRCSDDVLCHEDKDGHRLCGEEYCPLHRAMVTNQSSTSPVMLFARSKKGPLVPMRVSVAPIRSSSGEVIGGVETFRDLSSEFRDFQRVKTIQSLSLQAQLPEDHRISFSPYYIPTDIVGGDYYAIAPLDGDSYGFILADVTGHGVPAALYTMYLSSLWEEHRHLLSAPLAFAEAVNDSLCSLIKEDEPFAAGVCGSFDLKRGILRLTGAGNPPALLIRENGNHEHLDCSGLPLGIMKSAPRDEKEVEIRSGDCLLFFTDGAVEISDGKGNRLGIDGLAAILKNLGYPSPAIGFKTIEDEMLKHSDRIRFDDDVTFLEVRLS